MYCAPPTWACSRSERSRSPIWQGDVLAIETTGERKYAKEILLSAAPGSLQKSYTNGILELRLKKA